MITREVDFVTSTTKQETNNNNSDATLNLARATTTTTSWTRSKDPRIVRVSRAFGGKDRHSKVCTVRGLRDRRVRLSVPTAIQLYDLQDRLGLNQPSKVVDWLLDAAKNDIDQLPPLQFPSRIFDPFLHPPSTSSPSPATASLSDTLALSSFLRWDQSNSSNQNRHHGIGSSSEPKPEDHFHSFNNVLLSSSSSHATVSSQVAACPPPPPYGLQQYSFLHPHATVAPPEIDLKQMMNFQMLMSSQHHGFSSASLRPPQPEIESLGHHFVVRPMHFLHSHQHEGNDNGERSKIDEFSSS